MIKETGNEKRNEKRADRSPLKCRHAAPEKYEHRTRDNCEEEYESHDAGLRAD
ncbi:MAG: hypothetical protein V1885_02750 [Candidatus Brennerbacteria bacterium]